ncbi:uncharacterized protein B0H18DRAFT_977570, partial [Fomitopsis serialis]|uniref:uncharacterized protein n=1 Tax=Fomitopsis serialis TaxID=139415 RepID=UPI002008E835
MSFFKPSLSLSLIYFLLVIPHVAAANTNRTIDDTYGDVATGMSPIYTENWNPGSTCMGCVIGPSAEKAYMGTWHDTTSDEPLGTSNTAHDVALTFTGTAIWVYCIVADFDRQSITTFSNMSFELDGAAAGTYVHTPTGADQDNFEYNVTVYSVVGLSNVEHKLVMTAGQGTSASLILFDWAMYTFDGADTTDPPGTASTTLISQSGGSIQPSSSAVVVPLASSSAPSVSTMTVTSTPAGSAASIPDNSSSGSGLKPAASSTTTISSAPSSTSSKSGAAMNTQVNVMLSSLALLLSA